ncbi:HNH endonuclease [Mycobacterium dioxanotrophicus]|uniref:HNH endonuclease n=1 Tax=Mycobacterium dioxanotrophicus TaxID=482462 RepID=A0A1Y0C956_9MYCO|nr:HNH endonuclease signature motif containing protein [Mycobacterium dioxanotrophicus]ART71642.1 HNH endonuclease [Mycobacterium dioxanotrophicus]
MLANTVVDRDAVLAVFDEYDAVCDKLAGLNFDALSLPELLELASRRETQARRAPTVDHRLLAEAQTRVTAREIGAKSWADALAIRLRISPTEAKRRVTEAALLGPRTAVSGEPLPPVLPATATAQAAGQINTEHVAVIKKFFDKCPVPLDASTHTEIDTDLARIGAGNSPDILRRCAERIAYLLNQDGPEPQESVQERRRGIVISPQRLDGTSKIFGYLDAETAATLAPMLAKLSAPGMCNRADEHPCVDGTPSAEAIAADTRTAAQRTHDAFLAMGRALLASGKLGQHNGLPVSVVISTTVRELESLSGVATTGSGIRLSIPQVIHMAARARQYLAVFANHKEVPLYLGRAKRLASVGQRLALHARDGGCTKPGCSHPPDRCQGHHAERDYAQGGQTDITDLTLACPKDNRLVSEQGWSTRVRDDGRVEWIPPPLLDTGQDRLNHYWHPEDLFHPDQPTLSNDCGEDIGVDDGGHDADETPAELPSEPIEPGPQAEVSRPSHADETSDTGTDSNRHETPDDHAQPDDQATQIAGNQDTDDDALETDERPENPDPSSEEAEDTGSRSDTTQGPGNRDGPHDP